MAAPHGSAQLGLRCELRSALCGITPGELASAVSFEASNSQVWFCSEAHPDRPQGVGGIQKREFPAAVASVDSRHQRVGHAPHVSHVQVGTDLDVARAAKRRLPQLGACAYDSDVRRGRGGGVGRYRRGRGSLEPLPRRHHGVSCFLCPEFTVLGCGGYSTPWHSYTIACERTARVTCRCTAHGNAAVLRMCMLQGQSVAGVYACGSEWGRGSGSGRCRYTYIYICAHGMQPAAGDYGMKIAQAGAMVNLTSVAGISPA